MNSSIQKVDKWKDAESIQKWVTSAMNYDLRKIENITISQQEIDFLKTIESSKDRKLLFMTLVLSKALKHRGTRRKKTEFKISDNYYIHYNNFSDIIRLSGLKNVSEIDLADVYSKYSEHLTFILSPPKVTILLGIEKKSPVLSLTAAGLKPKAFSLFIKSCVASPTLTVEPLDA